MFVVSVASGVNVTLVFWRFARRVARWQLIIVCWSWKETNNFLLSSLSSSYNQWKVASKQRRLKRQHAAAGKFYCLPQSVAIEQSNSFINILSCYGVFLTWISTEISTFYNPTPCAIPQTWFCRLFKYRDPKTFLSDSIWGRDS